MPIGPSLPPHLAHLTKPAVDEESDDEDAFGPSLPPHLAAARKAATTPEAGPSRPFGSPSPPRIPGRAQQPPEYDDDSDDEVIGPVLPTDQVQEKSAVEEFLERERRMQARESSDGPKKTQREEWMLAPPPSGVLSAIDPLRKRPTTFSRNAKEAEIDHTVWTETPADRAQRMADEAAGIKRKKTGDDDVVVERERKRLRDEEIRREVERHNKGRGKSLLEQHTKKDKTDDPPAIWDHARDMGVTGRLLSDQERSQKIRDAKNLNDRFGHSKRGAYDM